MKNKNIVEVTNFSQKEWLNLIGETINFSINQHRKPNLLKDKQVCLMFDSNSLRTRLSFEIATHLLGGNSYYLDIHSLTHEQDGTKRESYEDIIETLDRMMDCYVIRDYSREMYNIFLRKNSPPFINGFSYLGHPSQALADLSVIKKNLGTVHNLQYTAVGPSNGSGVLESFIYGVLLLGEKITVITPAGKFKGKNYDFFDQIKKLQKLYGGKFMVTNKIKDTIRDSDILYVDEWWENNKNFLKKKMGKYQVNKTFLKTSKTTLRILHCMPIHTNREITADIVLSKKSIIYDESQFRLYSAMSLLAYLMK